jgi:hypothetical protein
MLYQLKAPRFNKCIETILDLFGPTEDLEKIFKILNYKGFMQNYPYEEWDPVDLFDQMIAEIIVVTMLAVISVMLWQKFYERRSSEVKSLSIGITAMCLTFLVALIPKFYALYDHENPWINGIPVFYHDQRLWWTNLSYIFIMITNLAIMHFIYLVFKKPSLPVRYMFLGLNIIFNIWSVYHGIFVVVPGVSSLTLPMSIIFIIISFYLWFTLFWFALDLYKRVEPSVFRQGIYIIALSAFCSIIAFIMYTFYSLLKLFFLGRLYFMFIIFTCFLLYLGYVLPPWFRKILEKREKK